MSDAKISIGGDASGVEAAMAIGLSAVKNFASEAKSAVSSAVASITSDFANVVTAQGKVSFSDQHRQVREFEASSARMAVAVGGDLQGIRSEAEAVGLSIGKRPAEVVAWSSEVGKLTGNFSAATQGMKGMAELAAATGRNVQDYRGLAVELQTIGRVSGDTSQAVGLLKSQADSLGVSGGVAAFAGQVERLGETFSYFKTQSAGDFGNLTEMAAKLGGGGANQATAGRIQQSVLGNIAGNSFQWSRFLGRDLYDKEGNLEDPGKTIGDIVKKIEGQYKSPAQGRRALMLQFGPQAGSRLHALHESGELYQSPKAPSPHAAGGQPQPADALKKYLGTDAGKRDEAQAQLAVASDKLLGSSSALGSAADKLQQFASHNPVVSTFGATVAGGLVSGGVKTASKTAEKILGLGSKGAPALGLLGTVGAGLAVGVGGIYAGWELAGGSEEVERQAEAERKAGYTPEQRHSLTVAKETRDRVRAARGMPAVPGALGGWTIPANDLELSRAAGTPEGQAAYQAQLQKEGLSEADAAKIGKAVADAMRSVNIQVQSTPDNPLSATVRTSQSSAAGAQGGT